MNSSTPAQRIEAILRTLEEGVEETPFEEVSDLARSHPDAVAELAAAVVRRFPRGGTFLDDALSFLPEARWEELVRLALDALEESGDNEAADSVISHASLQALSALHPHLQGRSEVTPPWPSSSTRATAGA